MSFSKTLYWFIFLFITYKQGLTVTVTERHLKVPLVSYRTPYLNAQIAAPAIIVISKRPSINAHKVETNATVLSTQAAARHEGIFSHLLSLSISLFVARAW